LRAKATEFNFFLVYEPHTAKNMRRPIWHFNVNIVIFLIIWILTRGQPGHRISIQQPENYSEIKTLANVGKNRRCAEDECKKRDNT
jgi:hypothetical protein